MSSLIFMDAECPNCGGNCGNGGLGAIHKGEANLDEAIEKYLKIIDSIHDGEGGQHDGMD